MGNSYRFRRHRGQCKDRWVYVYQRKPPALADDQARAYAALCALLAFERPWKGFRGILTAWVDAGGLEQVKKRATAATRGMGDPSLFVQRYRILEAHTRASLRRHPFNVIRLVFRSLPSGTQRDVLHDIPYRESGFRRLDRVAARFVQRHLGRSANGLWAVAALLSALQVPAVLQDAQRAMEENPVVRALVVPGKKPTSELQREAVQWARSQLKELGYTRLHLSTLHEAARQWATVQVKYGGSLSKAIKAGEFGNVTASNLSAATAQFDQALGTARTRGRKHEETPEATPQARRFRIAPTQIRSWYQGRRRPH